MKTKNTLLRWKKHETWNRFLLLNVFFFLKIKNCSQESYQTNPKIISKQTLSLPTSLIVLLMKFSQVDHCVYKKNVLFPYRIIGMNLYLTKGVKLNPKTSRLEGAKKKCETCLQSNRFCTSTLLMYNHIWKKGYLGVS